MRRLAGRGGDPVVQLQTNFGGGKTHAMLALYHLFSGTSPGTLPGMDAVLPETGIAALPAVKRVVLVGNRISPGNPVTKGDGTQVRTLWGELAWQLGFAAGGAEEARRAYERVRVDDERATNPGDALRVLLNDYGPCLILIDEWVAYARQLHDEGDLPAGSFETQFTFAQALTESAKLAENCLLVVSLPASDASDASDASRLQGDDSEVGGMRGRSALSRLSNVIGRVESSWRPGQRRGELRDRAAGGCSSRSSSGTSSRPGTTWRAPSATSIAPATRSSRRSAPRPTTRSASGRPTLSTPRSSTGSTATGRRCRASSARAGVLRLMAAVIHSLWEKGDRNPLILPANIPLDDSRVRFELTRYLPENWIPVIDTDIDGANSLPQRLDAEVPNLGKYGACRRVARSIYLGSAPTPPGREPRGRRPAGEARLRNTRRIPRRLRRRDATPGQRRDLPVPGRRPLLVLHAAHGGQARPRVARRNAGGARTTCTRTSKRSCARTLRDRGDFNAVHIFPASGHEVQDDMDAGLVVLRPDHAHVRAETSESRAVVAAKSILTSRGNSPRLYQNALAFLAADETRLQDLEQAVSLHQAWQSIVDDQESLNLPPPTGPAGEVAARRRRRRGRGAHRGDLRVAACAVAERSEGAGGVGGHQTLRTGISRRAGEQTDAERRTAGERLRAYAPAHGAGQDSAMARGPRSGRAVAGGLRPVHLLASAPGTGGLVEGRSRRPRADDLGAGLLRLRGQLRRGGGSVSGPPSDATDHDRG